MADVSWPERVPVQPVPELARRVPVAFRSVRAPERVQLVQGPGQVPRGLDPARALQARVQVLSLQVARQEERPAHPVRRYSTLRWPKR